MYPSRVALAIAPAAEMDVRDLPSLAKLGPILTRSLSGRKFLDNAADTLAHSDSARTRARHRALR